MRIDKTQIKHALVERNWTFTRLAQELHVPATTLSSWLNNRHPAPSDLLARIRRVLGTKSSFTVANEPEGGR